MDTDKKKSMWFPHIVTILQIETEEWLWNYSLNINLQGYLEKHV